MSDSIEVMNMAIALEKYSWLEDYLWNVVKPDADKYTAKTALNEQENGVLSGYFVRSLPGTKEVMPVQACMFISDEDVMQTAHNVIIAEENSELHLITGCATGDDVGSAMHVGVSEMYLKPGSKITFTMVHNWAEQVEVRPRTGVKLMDACHAACAIIAGCDYFISTDKRLLKYKTTDIKMVNPIDYIMEKEDE